jgi:glucose/arabinose dehydrogenase
VRNSWQMVAALVACSVSSSVFAQNLPPNTPIAVKPPVSPAVNPTSFLIESSPFGDPNPGDEHSRTDWEIWTAGMTERVWRLAGATGILRNRGYLSDGTFEGSYEGRTGLIPDTNYIMRLRHADNSGDPLTEWSAWGEHPFSTESLQTLFPLSLADVLTEPTPTLRDQTGAPVNLRFAGTPARIMVETTDGGLLLDVFGDPAGNQFGNPAALDDVGAVRVVISAGSGPLDIAATDLVFTAGDGAEKTIYLPATDLPAGGSRVIWVAANGSTFEGQSGQTEPDFSVFLRGAPVPWTAAPGYAIDLVASGFSLPSRIEFITNPGEGPLAPIYYVMELYGQIKVVLRNGEIRTYASGLLNYNPNGEFPGSGEQGLGDIAYDPSNGDLYLSYLYTSVPGNDLAAKWPAVDRLTSTDGGLTMATRTRILNMPGEEQGQAHYISNVSIGPDNNLYVHMGDGFLPATALNPDSYRGKILRLQKNGLPPLDNPFYNAADGINARDFTVALGMRNPFGGAWRISDGRLYFVENGPNTDRFAALVPGFNYGWDGTDESMFAGALFTWVPSVAPVNMDFAQAGRFGGSGFPPELLERAYVTQFGGTFNIGPATERSKIVTQFVINAAGERVEGPTTIASYNGTGASTAVALAAGPDGIYFSDFFTEFAFNNPTQAGASIFRIRWVGFEPPADCDGNGTPDTVELAAGEPDCNINGVPDSCDIATGRSRDCNQNGIPDECEVIVQNTETFFSGVGGWVLNGGAARVANAIRLTQAVQNRLASAILPGPTETLEEFQIAFDFRTGNGNGADGMSFAVFDADRYPSDVVFSEQGPGSVDNQAAGPGTLVITFNTYDNGEGENTISLNSNGAVLATFVPPFDLEDFAWRRVRVGLVNKRLSMDIRNPNGTVIPVFSNLLVSSYEPFRARFGFGARTGGLSNEHWVDNIAFPAPLLSVDADANGTLDTCQCPCAADYNCDRQLDLTDLADYVSDYFVAPAIPGGVQTAAPSHEGRLLAPVVGCPTAGDAPAPYAVNAYRAAGYRVGYSIDGSNRCPAQPGQFFPNLDNLSDFITDYFAKFELGGC